MKKEKFEYIKNLLDKGKAEVNIWTGEAHIRKVNGSGFLKWSECQGYFKTMSGGWSIALHELIAVASGLDVVDKHEKLYINHIDGNKKNCRFFNLEVLINSQNNKHAWKIGLKQVTPPRLTKTEVALIKFLANAGYKQAEISEAMNVSQTHVSSIVTGFRWASVNLNDYEITMEGDWSATTLQDQIKNLSVTKKWGV